MNGFTTRTVSLAVAVALTGCGTFQHRNEIQRSVDEGTKQVTQRTNEEHEAIERKSMPVREIAGVYLGAKTIKAAKQAELPTVFSHPLAYQIPDDTSLSRTAERIGKMLNMTVRVSPDALVPTDSFYKKPQAAAPAQNQVSIPPITGPIGSIAPNMSQTGNPAPAKKYIIDMINPFDGTVSEYLDKLCAKNSVGWDYKDGVIYISRFVTRTYELSNILDTNDLTAGVSKTSSTATSGASNSGGQSSSTSDLSSKVTAKIDALKGIEDAVKGVITPDYGKYSISSSGLITVTDTREVQEQVREIVAAEEKVVGRQIAVRLQVIQVEASQSDDTGFDLSWLIDNAARKWNVKLTSPTGMPGGSIGAGQIGVIRNGGESTTSLFIKAVSEIGKVSIKKDETYRMLNNRILSIATTDNYIYPAKSTPATSSTSGTSTTAAVGVEPGQLTTGTFLNLRSSVQSNGSVLMYFNLDASIRGKSKVYDSNGATLEYPASNGNQFTLYASAVSGETAVLASMDNSEQRSTDRSLDSTLSPLLGGGVAASTTRRAVLILMTPTIIEGVK